MKIALIALGATAFLAGSAQSQPLNLSLADNATSAPALQVLLPGQAPRPLPDLADPLNPHAPTVLVANPPESEIFAKTAIDHRFSQRNDLTGSLGFLCGRQPGHGDDGAAAGYGIDPHGRFVGAKLSIAF